MPQADVVAYSQGSTEIGRVTVKLNEGFAGGSAQDPFTVGSGEGKRYFLDLGNVPARAETCVLQFKVMLHLF